MSIQGDNIYYGNFISKVESREIKIGIIGIGYVGLPLALNFCQKGINVIGFDINQKIISSLNNGESHIKHIKSDDIKKEIKSNKLTITDNFSLIKDLDGILICVPTPLKKSKEPDLSFLIKSLTKIKKYLKKGQCISIESTTYPGTTNEIVKPIIESMNFKIGEDFFLIYSPEREDPGNKNFKVSEIPKIIGADRNLCAEIGEKLYKLVTPKVILVSSTKAAEMTKLLENVYRAVNIGLINELKTLAEHFDLDIHEIIRAADTKPFGFKAFYPGPGVGGHCIPIDPIYLSWKAKEEFNFSMKFIDLADEINSSMPIVICNKVIEALKKRSKLLNESKILVLGLTYKKNIDDCRESPSIKIINNLIKSGAKVSYCDPYIPSFSFCKDTINLESYKINPENIIRQDCILLITDHDVFEYELIEKYSKLIVDTRGRFSKSKNVISA